MNVSVAVLEVPLEDSLVNNKNVIFLNIYRAHTLSICRYAE